MADEEQQELFDQSEVAPPPAEEPVAPEAPVSEPEASIPSWRLREEAEARRVAEQRAGALEQRLQQVAAHIQQAQAQARARQQAGTPDFFANPAAATLTLIQHAVGPYAQEMRQQLMQLSRSVAEGRYGDEKVDEAERAFMDARAKQTLDPADYERVVTAKNRYDAVVQWYRRQNTLSKVGADPDAWFEHELSTRMANPEFQAKLLDVLRGDAATRPGVTRLPPSLSRATSAARNSEERGDMSDASLFAFAMKP